MKNRLLIAFIAFIMAGCIPVTVTSTGTPVPSATPSATPPPTLPQATSTAIPAATHTLTPIPPTNTVEPMFTPTPIGPRLTPPPVDATPIGGEVIEEGHWLFDPWYDLKVRTCAGLYCEQATNNTGNALYLYTGNTYDIICLLTTYNQEVWISRDCLNDWIAFLLPNYYNEERWQSGRLYLP